MNSAGDGAAEGWSVEVDNWTLQIRGESGLLQVEGLRDNAEPQGSHCYSALSFSRREVPAKKKLVALDCWGNVSMRHRLHLGGIICGYISGISLFSKHLSIPASQKEES